MNNSSSKPQELLQYAIALPELLPSHTLSSPYAEPRLEAAPSPPFTKHIYAQRLVGGQARTLSLGASLDLLHGQGRGVGVAKGGGAFGVTTLRGRGTRGCEGFGKNANRVHGRDAFVVAVLAAGFRRGRTRAAVATRASDGGRAAEARRARAQGTGGYEECGGDETHDRCRARAKKPG